MRKAFNSEDPVLRQFVEELPDSGFEGSGKLIFQGRNTVKLYEVSGRKIVVKRFKVPNMINRFAYGFFRGSKARRAYFNGLALEEYGVNTPGVLAYIETTRKSLMSYSYLVTEYTDYSPLSRIVELEKYEKVLLFNSFVKFTASLHEMGINHKDYNPDNVLYKKLAENQYEFQLIDINRMKFGHMGKKTCLSSINRFCSSSEVIYYMSQKYAEVRGWNKYGCLAGLALLRGIFESKKQTTGYIKHLIKGQARA